MSVRPLLGTLTLAVFATFAGAAAAQSDLVTIGNIDGESDTKMSIVNIRFDKQPGMSQVGELQDHGSFLQLVVPHAVVPEPGKFYDGGNPHVPKIAVFQLTATDAAIRFFVNSDAAAIKHASQAEILGNRIVLTIDHAKLAAGSAAALQAKTFVGPPVPEELRPKTDVSASDIIAKTEVHTNIPAPAEQLKLAALGAKALATGGLDLRDKLVKVAVFSAVMLLALAATWFVRPLLRRRARARGEVEPQICMKTIASLPLAPRQKVSLIQVGDEKILIGVTPEAVTFLTTISKHQGRPAPMAFARALEEGPAAVDMRRSPVLKNVEGNDEATLSTAAAPTPAVKTMKKTQQPALEQVVASARRAAPKEGGRINLAVGEDGIKQLSRPAPTRADTTEGSQNAIDDVTRLIREKLKTLRTI